MDTQVMEIFAKVLDALEPRLERTGWVRGGVQVFG